MKRYFIYIFLLLVVPVFSAQCQLNFREGQIVTAQNDTISGLIKDGRTPRNTKVCLFKEDKQSKVVRYSPDDLKSYKIVGGKYFASQTVFYEEAWNPVFTDVLLEGSINLYYFRKNKDVSYYLEKGDSGIIGLINRDKEVELTSNWGHSVYTNYDDVKIPLYKDALQILFQDSEIAVKMVEDCKYDHRSLVRITKSYIDETCEGDECITYERDLRKTRDRFGVYTGAHFSRIYFSDSNGESNLETTIPIGIFYAIPLPFIHDRLSFQAELVYRSIKYNQFQYIPDRTIYDRIEWNVIGIPVIINYKLSDTRISPTISIGKEFGFVTNSDVLVTDYLPIEGLVTQNQFIHRIQNGGWMVDLGMDYELSSKLLLFSNIRFQWHRNKIIANKYEDHFTFRNATGVMFDSYTAALHLGVKF